MTTTPIGPSRPTGSTPTLPPSTMKEYHLFYAPDVADEKRLPEDEAAHAVRVLRMKEGDDLLVTDGQGNFYDCTITTASSHRCLLQINQQRPATTTWQAPIHIAVAPTKHMERMEWLVEKATEITMLVSCNRQRLEYPPSVRKAIKCISARLHERLRCEDVAVECGLSASYLSKEFKECVGVTMHEYIVSEKLEASKELLEGAPGYDDIAYEEVGYYFGFCSQTHYIQCFKKKYGMTPKEYMERNAVK